MIGLLDIYGFEVLDTNRYGLLLGFGVAWGYRTFLHEFFTVPSAQQGEVQGTKTWVQGFAGAQEKLHLGLWEQGVGLVHVKIGNSLPVEMGVWSLWWFSPKLLLNTSNLLLI